MKHKKYFYFEIPRLKHILFLLYFISSLPKNLILDFLDEINNLSVPFFKIYIFVIADSLAIIPYIIVKKRSQKSILEKTPSVHSKKDIDLIYNDNEDLETIKIQNKAFINIVLLGLIDDIAQISLVIYYLIKQEYKIDINDINLNSLLIFNIIFIILLSKLMLHTQFYRHHYFSSILIILLLLVLVAIDIIQINKTNDDNKLISYIYLIIRIIRIFLYSLEDVIGKILLLYQNFFPYSILSNRAIIQFISSIIFSIPFIFIKLNDKGNQEKTIYEMIGDIFNEKINILYFLLLAIFSFFNNVFLWKIIDVFSPTHYCIAELFEGFGFLIIKLIKDISCVDGYFILRIIMYILLILIACIYNEFLVINICGLGKETQTILNIKEKTDKILVEYDENGINPKESFAINEMEMATTSNH